MAETDLYGPVLLLASRLGARLFRNNVGVARYRKRDGGECRVRYGLTPGSSDMIGWTTVTVTPEMVGQRVAIFTAMEVKTPSGRLSKAQRAFLAAVRAAGGIAASVRSEADAEAAIERARTGSAEPSAPYSKSSKPLGR